MKQFVTFSLLLALALGSCGPSPESGGCMPAEMDSGGRLLGEPAPNFTLSLLDGGEMELVSVVQGHPALLVFWATWCPTCKEEIPILNEWTEKYPMLRILGINVQESRERVKAFTQKRKIQYPILLDEEGEVAQLYGLVGIPASILVAKGGRVIYYGFALPQNVDRLIQE